MPGPIFCRYGPARIRGLLDGRKRPHPLSRRNYKGPVRFEEPVRHALRISTTMPLAGCSCLGTSSSIRQIKSSGLAISASAQQEILPLSRLESRHYAIEEFYWSVAARIPISCPSNINGHNQLVLHFPWGGTGTSWYLSSTVELPLNLVVTK
jgi:hypothetical protein